MKTAIDTNILSAVWMREVNAHELSIKLADARSQGLVVICGAVFAEALANPNMNESLVRSFLRDTHIQIDTEMSEYLWSDAGRRYAGYVKRKRRSSQEAPKRFLADFIIGSHALHQADRLMTLDKGRYRTDYPELILL